MDFHDSNGILLQILVRMFWLLEICMAKGRAQHLNFVGRKQVETFQAGLTSLFLSTLQVFILVLIKITTEL